MLLIGKQTQIIYRIHMIRSWTDYKHLQYFYIIYYLIVFDLVTHVLSQYFIYQRSVVTVLMTLVTVSEPPSTKWLALIYPDDSTWSWIYNGHGSLRLFLVLYVSDTDIYFTCWKMWKHDASVSDTRLLRIFYH